MTPAGATLLLLVAAILSGWILDLVRRGRLYVGYGIVLLALLGLVAAVSVLPPLQRMAEAVLGRLFPSEPVAVIGLSAVLFLLIYLLHQLSVLADRVANLTQELAIRRADAGPDSAPADSSAGKSAEP